MIEDPEQLRAMAAELREESAKASAEHVRLAREMVGLVGSRYLVAKVQAGVADCMSRRYRLWADQYELAALELEEPA